MEKSDLIEGREYNDGTGRKVVLTHITNNEVFVGNRDLCVYLTIEYFLKNFTPVKPTISTKEIDYSDRIKEVEKETTFRHERSNRLLDASKYFQLVGLLPRSPQTNYQKLKNAGFKQKFLDDRIHLEKHGFNAFIMQKKLSKGVKMSWANGSEYCNLYIKGNLAIKMTVDEAIKNLKS